MRSRPLLLFLICSLLLQGCQSEVPALRGEIASLGMRLEQTTRRMERLEENEAESLKVLGCSVEESRFLDFIRTCSDTTCSKEDINLKVVEIFRDNRLVTHLSPLRHKVVYPERRSDDIFDLNPADRVLLDELLGLPALPTRRFVIVANYAGTAQADGQERGDLVRRFLLRPQRRADRTVPNNRVELITHSFGLQRGERLSRADTLSVQPDLRRSVWVFYVLC